MRFTNSPFERMMQQVPSGGERPRPDPLPRHHPCHGCGSYHGVKCVSCYRDLIIRPKERKDRV